MRARLSTHALTQVFALCLFLAGIPLFAQGLPAAAPESVGLSQARLDRIAEAVQRSVDEKRIAGAVTLVARRGRIAWLKAQGFLDRESGKVMQPDAIFRICSMTKPITSAAVMMLYEEGRFLLNDPVSKYIPEFRNPKVLVKSPSGPSYTILADREITIRQLMTHDHLGTVAADLGFGLGFGIEGEKGPLQELGSPGQFSWGGFFYTEFFIDPKEQLIGVFMAQLHPTGDLSLNRAFSTLVYQAIND